MKGLSNMITAKINRQARNNVFPIALMMLVVWSAPSAAGGTPPEGYVQSMAVGAIEVLSDRALAAERRREKFGRLILQSFDAPAIGRYVLGAKWATATPDQQDRFLRVYNRVLIQTYTDRFFDYDGHSLQVLGSQPEADGTTLVRTTVATPTGSSTYNVDWNVGSSSSGLKFIDVIIDGVSTNQTTRQDYAAVLRSSGGNVDGLISLLEAKTP